MSKNTCHDAQQSASLPNGHALPVHWYAGDTNDVAKRLLGKVLCRRVCSAVVLRGVIVEVEAYLHAGDAASHSARGLTRSNASMYKPAGHLYVYPIHAKHCLNIVTESEGRGAAVLIRALEPIDGLSTMLENRSQQPPRNRSDWRSITTGPGRICQALRVDRSVDGLQLTPDNPLWIESIDDSLPAFHRTSSTRIGISTAQSLKLRHFVDGNQFVSGLAREHSRPRTGRLFGITPGRDLDSNSSFG